VYGNEPEIGEAPESIVTVNEMELHPHLQQLIRGGSRHPACKLLSDWRTGRPERGRLPEDSAPAEDPVEMEAPGVTELIRLWFASSGPCSVDKSDSVFNSS
jgi:hypothetical protein